MCLFSHNWVYNNPMSCISGLQIKLFWEGLVLALIKAENHPISLTLTPAQPEHGHKCNTANCFPIIGRSVQNEFWIIRCISNHMKYRLRNLQCEFQHLNIVTAVNGYEMMLLLALKDCPGLWILGCHLSIAEMLDILVSNTAYTASEKQRKCSAVS